jgi:hypothetical protein
VYHLILYDAGGPEYTYVGCYKEGSGPYPIGQRAFPVSVIGAGVSVEECAVAARHRGYPIFALQWYNECFMGSVADLAKMNAASQKTTDVSCGLIPCNPFATSCPGWLNKVYLLQGMPGSVVASQRLDDGGNGYNGISKENG